MQHCFAWHDCDDKHDGFLIETWASDVVLLQTASLHDEVEALKSEVKQASTLQGYLCMSGQCARSLASRDFAVDQVFCLQQWAGCFISFHRDCGALVASVGIYGCMFLHLTSLNLLKPVIILENRFV